MAQTRKTNTNEVTFFKKARFEVSLAYRNLYNWVTGSKKRDLIIPHLILGQIPTVDDAKEILKEYPDLGCIFSINEDYELDGDTIFLDPNVQSRKAWNDMNVDTIQLSMEDFTAISDVEKIYKIIQQMHDYISHGWDVYLHCKAGVGRSPMICVCYLFIYGGNDNALVPGASVKEIRDFIFSKRKQISLSEENYKKIEELIQYHERLQNEKIERLDRNSTQRSTTVINNLNQVCISYEDIYAIKMLPAMKNLKNYAEKKEKTKISHHINKFFRHINEAKNCDWYIELLNKKGPMQDLLDERPGWLGGEPKKRKELVDDLKNALREFFIAKIKCFDSDIAALNQEVLVENISLCKL